MIYGFIGARKGTTALQFHTLAERLTPRSRADVVLLADRLGADEQVLYLVTARDYEVRRVDRLANDQLTNAAIVDACGVLIVAPSGPESAQSPTWGAVRYARSIGRAVVVVAPDGAVTKQSGRGPA